MDFMPQLIWSTNADGEVDYFNELAMSYSGFTYKTLMGNGWTQMLHPDNVNSTLEGGSRFKNRKVL